MFVSISIPLLKCYWYWQYRVRRIFTKFEVQSIYGGQTESRYFIVRVKAATFRSSSLRCAALQYIR